MLSFGFLLLDNSGASRSQPAIEKQLVRRHQFIDLFLQAIHDLLNQIVDCLALARSTPDRAVAVLCSVVGVEVPGAPLDHPTGAPQVWGMLFSFDLHSRASFSSQVLSRSE